MRLPGPVLLVPLLLPACGGPPPRPVPAPEAPLGKLDLSRASADLLARHLTDPDYEVREAASRTLEGAGADAVPLLAALFPGAEPEVAWRVRRALARVGWPSEALIARAEASGPGAAPLLASVLEDDLIDRAAPALAALARLGPSAFEAVAAAAASPDWRTRYHAARVLGLLADPRSAGLLERLSREEEPGVRFAAAGGLLRQGRPEAYQALTASLRSQAQGESAATAFYNLACVACLGGRLGEAEALLRQSVELGFDDLRVLDNDADLYDLRRTAGWEALRRRMREGAPE